MNEKERTTEQLLSIGEKLTAARKYAGYTQSEAAAELGCSQSFLSAVERGKKAFSINLVLDMIKLYKISYEAVFGENNGDRNFTFDSPSQSITDSLALLNTMISKVNSPLLKTGVDEYIKMCVYFLLRELYEENPHNTTRLFSTDKSQADKAAGKIIISTPQQFHTFIERCHIDRRSLELPVEKGSELRKFISECEQLFENENTSDD